MTQTCMSHLVTHYDSDSEDDESDDEFTSEYNDADFEEDHWEYIANNTTLESELIFANILIWLVQLTHQLIIG